MLVMIMFKKNKINVSLWYLVSVIGMAVLYFLMSDKMLTSKAFRQLIADYLLALGWAPSVEYNWGIFILVALIVYWGLIYVFRED